MTAVHVYIDACTYYIYYSKRVSDAVDKSDCYGANLIDILKFQTINDQYIQLSVSRASVTAYKEPGELRCTPDVIRETTRNISVLISHIQ